MFLVASSRSVVSMIYLVVLLLVVGGLASGGIDCARVVCGGVGVGACWGWFSGIDGRCGVGGVEMCLVFRDVMLVIIVGVSDSSSAVSDLVSVSSLFSRQFGLFSVLDVLAMVSVISVLLVN